jgi:L-amino acid N-acyltransferase YncA
LSVGSRAGWRVATVDDADGLSRIYNHYVRETVITFEEVEVTPEEMARRVENVRAAGLPWLVSEREGALLGYAYATRWKERSAYRFAVETTVYVDPAHAGRGIGSALYTALLGSLEALGIHTAIGGIALPNDASVRLHERFGFVKVAHFAEVGFKFGRHIDVGYWQLLIGEDGLRDVPSAFGSPYGAS